MLEILEAGGNWDSEGTAETFVTKVTCVYPGTLLRKLGTLNVFLRKNC